MLFFLEYIFKFFLFGREKEIRFRRNRGFRDVKGVVICRRILFVENRIFYDFFSLSCLEVVDF